MIAIKLDKDLGCDHICKQLENMFIKYRQANIDLNNKVLVIQVNDIADCNINLQPKIEHQPMI